MAKLDVYEYLLPGPPFVLNVQAEILDVLSTRAVIPLFPLKDLQNENLPERLRPLVKFNGKKYVVMTTEIAALPANEFGETVTNLEHYRYEITDALDFLFQGF